MIVFPKDDAKYRWTNHVKRKMAFYSLSGDRIKRIIRSPKRCETGVAENTIAVMQESGTKKKPTEIWTMYQLKKNRKVVISAWRYPAVSKPGTLIPIPAGILRELKEEGVLLDTNSIST